MFELADVAGNVVSLQAESSPALTDFGAAAVAVGLAAFGSGYAERGIGAAAVGALAEDSISVGIALLMTVLPETLVILALLVVFLRV
jgi:V/A-type H+-transporting ATPase subunit K